MVSALGRMFVILWIAVCGVAQNPCECEVTNRYDVVTASGTCFIQGQGQVSCVTAVLGSIPGGRLAAPGICLRQAGEATICPGPGQCTYAPIRVVVTAVSCASSCLGGACMEAKLDGVSYTPAVFVCAGAPGVNVDCTPGAAGNSCGAGDFDRFATLKDSKNRTVFEIRFRFGCYDCSTPP
jgi:hypothetical protein